MNSHGSLKIGVFAYQKKRGELQIALVTTRSGKRWIVPKGKPEPHLSDREVAVMEAYEEAGVLGSPPDGRYWEIQGWEKGELRTLRLYPLKIRQCLSRWPEKKFRMRKLVSLKKSIKLIDDEQLNALLQEIADVINSKAKPSKNSAEVQLSFKGTSKN